MAPFKEGENILSEGEIYQLIPIDLESDQVRQGIAVIPKGDRLKVRTINNTVTEVQIKSTVLKPKKGITVGGRIVEWIEE